MIGRRELLKSLAIIGVTGIAHLKPVPAGAEPPPETPRLRLARITDLCLGTPQLVAEDLLRTEGFSEIEYVDAGDAPKRFKAVAEGKVDVSVTTGAPIIIRVDAGDPITLLAGLHVGCFGCSPRSGFAPCGT